jgi:hypothetical protein
VTHNDSTNGNVPTVLSQSTWIVAVHILHQYNHNINTNDLVSQNDSTDESVWPRSVRTFPLYISNSLYYRINNNVFTNLIRHKNYSERTLKILTDYSDVLQNRNPNKSHSLATKLLISKKTLQLLTSRKAGFMRTMNMMVWTLPLTSIWFQEV